MKTRTQPTEVMGTFRPPQRWGARPQVMLFFRYPLPVVQVLAQDAEFVTCQYRLGVETRTDVFAK